MDFSWNINIPKKNQTTKSKEFEAMNRTFRTCITHKENVLFTIEYLGNSFSDLITKIFLTINGTDKNLFFSFNRSENEFSFPILQSEIYKIELKIEIHSPPYSSKKETGFAGLRNLGATCYMNAFLQTIFHLKKFSTEMFKLEPKRRTFQLQKLFYKMMNDSDIDTRSFVNNCRWFSNVNFHQDIHEFGKMLFDMIELENKKVEISKDEKNISYKSINSEDKNVNEKKFSDSNSQEENKIDKDEESKNISNKEENFNNNHENDKKDELNSDNLKTSEKSDYENNEFFIDELFQGKILNYIKCECGCFRSIEEKMEEIQVEIRDWCNNTVASNLRDGIKLLKKEEELEGDNQYRCEEHGLVNAVKGIEFVKLPPVLTILLKRFAVDYETGEVKKINDFYEFYETIEIDSCNNNLSDENLTVIKNKEKDEENIEEKSEEKDEEKDEEKSEEKDLSKVDSDSSINKLPRIENTYLNPKIMQGVPSISSDSPDPIKYKLYGVIVHSGITNDGHYYCYLNINGWYKFNDTIVTKVSKEEALFHNFGGSYPYKNREKIHNAYILLYIDEKEYENIVLNEIIISDFLKNKIIESESGKTLNINFIQRSDIFNYMGIGLFRNINKRNLQVRSDDTLYVLTKDSYKRNSYIYDTSDFSLLSNDSGIEENKSYYLHECNEKKKKDDFLLFFKKYSAADNCFFVENISLVVNHSVFVSKNEKISEFKEKTFLSDDLLVFYAEEEEISEENVNSIKNDIENNHIDTRRDLGNVKIFKDDNSLSSNSETVKKEVNEIIEEKIKNTKELKIKYKLRILDLDKSFEENNLKDGSIICILNKENEERFLNEYEYINNSKLISFITEKNTRQFYIDKKFIYGELLNFVKKIYMNKDLEIVKFEGSLDFNKIEKVIIKGVKENKIIGFCCAVNAFNLNKIKHRHEIICDSLKVKNIVKKISNLECVKKALKNDHLELYTRNDVHEELNVEDGFNKKIYDNIKENYRIFEVFEENPIMKEYEFVDEITGDGLLVLREKTKYKEIRIMFYNGEKFLGLPIFISIEKDKFTLGNLREKYSIVTELFKFDGEDIKQIDNDERLDKFDITDILVNITQYI